MEAWQPVVDLPFDEEDVERTIADFGRCVDAIEDGEFAAPSPEVLGQPRGTRRRKDHGAVPWAVPRTRADSEPTFAQIHCRNCDARFSCSSYREYERAETRRGRRAATLAAADDADREQDLDEWIEANLADDT